jgi:ornithine decarboxylase
VSQGEFTSEPRTRVEAIRTFLDRERPPTPCLVVDLDIVRANYAAMREALPEASVLYAVKANPAPEIVRLLAGLGCGFDVASRGEVDLCLTHGVEALRLSYGNTIKKATDIVYAHRLGVRRFSFDSADDLENLGRLAPGSVAVCRFLVDAPASGTPFGRKFGCSPTEAVSLLARAAELGLRPAVSFHVGSQQCEPRAWESGARQAVEIAETLADKGIAVESINAGGGFPVGYATAAPALDSCVAPLRGVGPRLFIEPGRALVATAGLIRAEVVSVTARPERWVYLDVGRYNGLAETENEYIAYPLTSSRPSTPDGPVVIAGPTCDGDDVLYQRTPYRLPLALRAGDLIDLHHAGAYTASYSSVSFNGIAPLATYFVGGAPDVGSFAGRHVLAELHGADAAVLDDDDFLRGALERSLKQAGATVCEVVSKRFDPQGVTVVAVLTESHASVHTYPERGSVFVDVFTCGRRADPQQAVRLLGEALGASVSHLRTIHRGQS